MHDAKNRSTIGLGIKKNKLSFFESKTYKINGLNKSRKINKYSPESKMTPTVIFKL